MKKIFVAEVIGEGLGSKGQIIRVQEIENYWLGTKSYLDLETDERYFEDEIKIISS